MPHCWVILLWPSSRCRSSLCIPDINPLSHTSLVNIFSHALGCVLQCSSSHFERQEKCAETEKGPSKNDANRLGATSHGSHPPGDALKHLSFVSTARSLPYLLQDASTENMFYPKHHQSLTPHNFLAAFFMPVRSDFSAHSIASLGYCDTAASNPLATSLLS